MEDLQVKQDCDKNIYVIDLSDNLEPGSLRKMSNLPSDLDRDILGTTKIDPEILPAKKNGIT